MFPIFQPVNDAHRPNSSPMYMRRQNNVGCDGTTGDTVSKICNCETSGVSQVLHIMRGNYIITTND